MKVSIAGQPSYALAYCYMDAGESVSCESGGMVAMSAGVKVNAALEGGLMRSAFRKAFADESLVMARYTALAHGAWVAVAPRFPGDIAAIDLDGTDGICMQSASLLAHSQDIVVDTRLSGAAAILMREGVSVMQAGGTGLVLVSAYGALQSFNLEPGHRMIVDTGHLVAWSPSCQMRVGPLSGVVSSQLTGEGLVAEITGPGRIWIQSRAEQGIRDWLFPSRGHDTGA